VGTGQSFISHSGPVELRPDKLLEPWQSPDVVTVDFVVFHRRLGFAAQS